MNQTILLNYLKKKKATEFFLYFWKHLENRAEFAANNFKIKHFFFKALQLSRVLYNWTFWEKKKTNYKIYVWWVPFALSEKFSLHRASVLSQQQRSRRFGCRRKNGRATVLLWLKLIAHYLYKLTNKGLKWFDYLFRYFLRLVSKEFWNKNRKLGFQKFPRDSFFGFTENTLSRGDSLPEFR